VTSTAVRTAPCAAATSTANQWTSERQPWSRSYGEAIDRSRETAVERGHRFFALQSGGICMTAKGEGDDDDDDDDAKTPQYLDREDGDDPVAPVIHALRQTVHVRMPLLPAIAEVPQKVRRVVAPASAGSATAASLHVSTCAPTSSKRTAGS
jgi:hypothetical protein